MTGALTTNAEAALRIKCTYCRAPAGEPCVTRTSGKTRKDPHAERERAAPTTKPGSNEMAEWQKRNTAHLDFYWAEKGMADPRTTEMYDPPEAKRIPEGGAYVMLTRTLPLAPPYDQATPGRVFWATWPDDADDTGFNAGGYYKLELHTPWGKPHAWPYEYVVLPRDRIAALHNAGELVFHAKDVSARELGDAVFYLRSRGISRADATAMALGSVEGDVGWFEPAPHMREAVEAFCAQFQRPMGRAHRRAHKRGDA